MTDGLAKIWARDCPLLVCFAHGPHCHRTCTDCSSAGFTNLACRTCAAFRAAIVDDIGRRFGQEPPVVRPPGSRRCHHFIKGPSDRMVSVHDPSITKPILGRRRRA